MWSIPLHYGRMRVCLQRFSNREAISWFIWSFYGTKSTQELNETDQMKISYGKSKDNLQKAPVWVCYALFLFFFGPVPSFMYHTTNTRWIITIKLNGKNVSLSSTTTQVEGKCKQHCPPLELRWFRWKLSLMCLLAIQLNGCQMLCGNYCSYCVGT